MGTCPGSNGVFRFEIALPVSEELCLQASHLLCPEERKKEERRKKEEFLIVQKQSPKLF